MEILTFALLSTTALSLGVYLAVRSERNTKLLLNNLREHIEEANVLSQEISSISKELSRPDHTKLEFGRRMRVAAYARSNKHTVHTYKYYNLRRSKFGFVETTRNKALGDMQMFVPELAYNDTGIQRLGDMNGYTELPTPSFDREIFA